MEFDLDVLQELPALEEAASRYARTCSFTCVITTIDR